MRKRLASSIGATGFRWMPRPPYTPQRRTRSTLASCSTTSAWRLRLFANRRGKGAQRGVRFNPQHLERNAFRRRSERLAGVARLAVEHDRACPIHAQAVRDRATTRPISRALSDARAANSGGRRQSRDLQTLRGHAPSISKPTS